MPTNINDPDEIIRAVGRQEEQTLPLRDRMEGDYRLYRLEPFQEVDGYGRGRMPYCCTSLANWRGAASFGTADMRETAPRMRRAAGKSIAKVVVSTTRNRLRAGAPP